MSVDAFSSQNESPRTWDIPAMPPADRLGVRTGGHRASDATLSARAVCHYIKVEPDSNVISYTGPGTEDTEAAAIRTAESIPRDCPLYYFEVEIINRGVGVMEANVFLHRLPGWEAYSYGYHGDDGNIFHGEGKGKPYGHKYTTGDIVGVCIDRVQRVISFYKNGMCNGVAFRDVTTAPLFPCVGFRSRDAKVCVNLGAQPFRQRVHRGELEMLCGDEGTVTMASVERSAPKWVILGLCSMCALDSEFSSVARARVVRHGVSLESLKADVTALVADQISRASIPTAAGSNASPMALAILDHLIHTCCWKTAQVVARDMLGSHNGHASAAPLLSDDDVRMMCMRQKLRQLIESGEAMQVRFATPLCPDACAEHGTLMQARDMLEDVCPGLLHSRPDVKFTLELQCFVELLRGSSPSDQSLALQFARSSLPQLDVDSSRQEYLREVLALLAYDDPLQSPSAFLFRQEKRVACAAEVNGAIMRHQGRQACSAVESLYSQLEVVRSELVASGTVAAQLVSLKDVLSYGLPRCARASHLSDASDSSAMQE